MNTELVAQAQAQIEALQATLKALQKDAGYAYFPLELSYTVKDLKEIATALKKDEPVEEETEE